MQPQLRHQSRLGQHRQQRMLTGFCSLFDVIARAAYLRLSDFVPKSRGIQIQRVALLLAAQPMQTLMPEERKSSLIVACRGETLQVPRRHRLTGNPRDVTTHISWSTFLKT